MKVYISGKVTGIEITAPSHFQAAETKLLALGHTVINPLKLIHDHDKSWKAYMLQCVKAMLDCDAVYMLLNWKESKGARIEHDLAKSLDMKIIYNYQI